MGRFAMRKGLAASLQAFLAGLLSRTTSRQRGEHQLNQSSSGYNDVKDIEGLVGTFRQLVSKLSREGNELGELYLTAEKKAARYALLSETVIESVSSGIMVVDRGGEVGLMNSSARLLLGTSAGDGTSPVRLNSLFSEAGDLEALVRTSFKTGQNSARNSVEIRTLDGMSRTIGASISCLRGESDVDAVIVVFTELDSARTSGREPSAEDKATIERESYLRGVLDSYDLISGITARADEIQGMGDRGGMDRGKLVEFARAVRHTCDLMMVFAVSKGGSSSRTELADLNGMVESVLRRKKITDNSGLLTNLSANIPRVKTVGKVFEMGLEMLIQGCLEESPGGIEINTALWRDQETDLAGVTIRERSPTKPIVEIGDSLREFAADNRLRREAGLLLLKSLPSDGHRIRVEKRGDSFFFSAGILVPIEKEAGPRR
jgi:PAS domain-containing protein